jgi:hypothetical protein
MLLTSPVSCNYRLTDIPTTETAVKEILPYAIEELECAEYEIVAVDTCLGECFMSSRTSSCSLSNMGAFDATNRMSR